MVFLLHEFILAFDCLESVALEVCLGREIIVGAWIGAVAVAVIVVLVCLGNVVCQGGLAILVVVFRGDLGELLPSLGLDLLWLRLRVCFEGVDLKLTHILLQFKVLLLQLLHKSIILLNFLTFLLQFLNSSHRTNLLSFVLLQLLLQLLNNAKTMMVLMRSLHLKFLLLHDQTLVVLLQIAVVLLIASGGFFPFLELEALRQVCMVC